MFTFLYCVCFEQSGVLFMLVYEMWMKLLGPESDVNFSLFAGLQLRISTQCVQVEV